MSNPPHGKIRKKIERSKGIKGQRGSRGQEGSKEIKNGKSLSLNHTIKDTSGSGCSLSAVLVALPPRSSRIANPGHDQRDIRRLRAGWRNLAG